MTHCRTPLSCWSGTEPTVSATGACITAFNPKGCDVGVTPAVQTRKLRLRISKCFTSCIVSGSRASYRALLLSFLNAILKRQRSRLVPHISGLTVKKKNHIACWRNTTPFIILTLIKLAIEGNVFGLIKNI